MIKFCPTDFFCKIHPINIIWAKNCQIVTVFGHFWGVFSCLQGSPVAQNGIILAHFDLIFTQKCPINCFLGGNGLSQLLQPAKTHKVSGKKIWMIGLDFEKNPNISFGGLMIAVNITKNFPNLDQRIFYP